MSAEPFLWTNTDGTQMVFLLIPDDIKDIAILDSITVTYIPKKHAKQKA